MFSFRRVKKYFSIVIYVALFIAVVFFHFGENKAVSSPVPASSESVDSGSAKILPEKGKLYDVVRVVDGDTLVVRIDGTEEKVRLIGINTPETVDPRKSVQCFGKEASDEAKKILEGKQIILNTDPTQDAFDKYGRLLAYARTTDGIFYNEFMIEKGYAYEYTYDVPYEYQKDFKQKEKEAKEGGVGLWAVNTCAGKF